VLQSPNSLGGTAGLARLSQHLVLGTLKLCGALDLVSQVQIGVFSPFVEGALTQLKVKWYTGGFGLKKILLQIVTCEDFEVIFTWN